MHWQIPPQEDWEAPLEGNTPSPRNYLQNFLASLINFKQNNMKIENVEGLFSYKENPSLRFSNDRYLLVMKDEDTPDRAVHPLLYVDRKSAIVENIDGYDMDKIQVFINHHKPEQSFERFDNLYQILKVSYGTVIPTNYEDDTYKCKTFANNINPTSKDELIEVVEGDILESEGKIKVKNPFLISLISDVYAQQKHPIFVQSEQEIVGPFIVVGKDKDDFLVKKYLKKDYPFGIYEITEEAYVEFSYNSVFRKIHIVGLNKLDFVREIDFKDDEQILTDFVKHIKENLELLDKDRNNELLSLLNSVRNTPEAERYINENKRVYTLLEKATEKLIVDYKISEIFPQKVKIDEVVESLKREEDQLRSTLRNYDQQLTYLQEKIKETTEELSNLEKIKEEKLAQEQHALEEEVKQLTEKRNHLAANLQQELNQLTEKIVLLHKEEDELKVTLSTLQQQNRLVQQDAQTELINLLKHKKYFDFFNGRDLSDYERKNEKVFTDFSLTDAFDTYTTFRDNIQQILSKNGRDFETHFIDNLLIAIHQNTLTILAGLPGTGKTSLARLLTQILAPKERITEVSVSRGWSSPKDLIGFQNPLTNKFHSAPTGVYELLEQLNYEVQTDRFFAAPLAFIILDEANLSPIEHYWSNFYNLTDSVAQKGDYLSIPLGNNHTLHYANNLRFIATINYDYTTEPLSPRVIDRTNIIQLPELQQPIQFISKDEVETLRISFQKCIEFFHLLDFQTNDRETLDFTDETNQLIFSQIKEAFKNLRLPISYRVELGIKRYCSMAHFIDDLDERTLLDYCIAQRLLPMLNIQGEHAKEPIEALLLLLTENQLQVSEKILEKIVEIGENNEILGGNYSYFLTLSYA